jgi:hypothetical protein
MALRPTSLSLIRLGLGLVAVAIASSIWEVLASQAPSSPFYAGVLPGPVGQLRSTATTLGLLMFVAALLLPRTAPDLEPRTWLASVYVGVAITLGAMIYGATTGMLGVQITDPRPESVVLFVVRATGQAVLIGAFAVAGRRLWRGEKQ